MGPQRRAAQLRNALVAAQVAIGGAIRFGKWEKFLGDPSACPNPNPTPDPYPYP